MNAKANWLAWSLQLIFGALLGGVAGAASAWGRGRAAHFHFSDDEGGLAFGYVLGCSMVIGGLASYFGDELWLGSSLRAYQPPEMPHSAVSRGSSLCIGIVGLGLIVITLGAHFGLPPVEG